MSYTADYPIHEGYSVSIFAQVEYDIEGASGDGWNEPHEPAHAYVVSATLYRVERKPQVRWDADQRRNVVDGHVEVRTELGEAPQWVIDLIKADDDWLGDLATDDGPDPDAWRDNLIHMQLMEG